MLKFWDHVANKIWNMVTVIEANNISIKCFLFSFDKSFRHQELSMFWISFTQILDQFDCETYHTGTLRKTRNNCIDKKKKLIK